MRWLEQEGYGPVGILGASIGSSIAFITMCHEPALRAGAFLHVATYFGDVVANGLTTMNVWESLSAKISHEQARGLLGADQSLSLHCEAGRRRGKTFYCQRPLRPDVLAGISATLFWKWLAGMACRWKVCGCLAATTRWERRRSATSPGTVLAHSWRVCWHSWSGWQVFIHLKVLRDRRSIERR